VLRFVPTIRPRVRGGRSISRAVYVFIISIVAVVVVATPTLAAQYPPKAAVCTISPGAAQPGSRLTVRGANWQPGASVAVGLRQGSTTQPLGSAVADAKGGFRTAVLIPSTTNAGWVYILFAGHDRAGDEASCTSRLRVLIARPTAATLPSASAFTAGLSIAIGGILGAVVLVRRRRSLSVYPREIEGAEVP
jgi:hypothetical protein